MTRLTTLLTPVFALWAGGAAAAIFPSNSAVFFQTSGCQRAAGIGDWYTTATSASTARYGEFFLEVTDAMAPATVTILDAESVDGGGGEAIDDEITGANDSTRFELRSGDGATLLQTSPIFTAAGGNGQTATFAGLAVGVYRIRSYVGSDQVPGLSTGAYCDQAAGDNDDDNAFLIRVNGTAAIDGLLGYLQTTYQQNTGAVLAYQMYFLVGPSAADTTLQLRNFDLDGGATGALYTRPPDAMGAAVAGTVSGNAAWNNGGTLNAGQDAVLADNDLAGGAAQAGTWGYRIAGWTSTNQTIFEANNAGVRLALTDAVPTRAGYFGITPSTTLFTTTGVAVDHAFSVSNEFFTDDLINFTLTNTSANYSVQLRTDPNCDGSAADSAVLASDADNDGQLDTGLLASAGQAGDTRCFFLRTTPGVGAASSDGTRVNGVSLMDAKVVPASNTTRFVTKTTLLPPSLAKSFSPNPMAAGGSATLSFTLTNPNTVPAALSGAGPNFAFTDVFPVAPGAMTLANATVTNTCGGALTDNGGGALNAGDTGIRYSGGTIPASNSCTVAVDVTAAVEGSYANSSTALVSTSAGTGNAANATLTVQAMVAPSLAKSFAPNPVAVNADTTLTITIANSNPAALAGLAFGDTYPAGLVNAPAPGVTNTCGGSTTGGAAGGSTIGLTGGALAANSSCSVTVQVRSGTNASYLNTAGPVTSANAGTGNSASATLVVHAPPTISKAFAPDPINSGSPSVLTVTLTNPNATSMTGATFTDTFPAAPAGSAIVIAGTPGAATTCSGSLDENDAIDGDNLLEAGDGSIRLTDGVIPAGGSCEVTVNVTKNATGTGTNTIAAGSLTTTNGIASTAAASDTLTSQAVAGPTVTKSFSPDPIQNGGTSTLTLVLGNPNPTATLIDIAFTDTFPAAPGGSNIDIAATPAASTTCNGVLDENDAADGDNLIDAGDGSIRLTGASLLAGATCTVTVNVTKTATGTGTNTIPVGGVTSSNGGANTVAATDTLTSNATVQPPLIDKVFVPDEIGAGMTSVLNFTVTNPNNATLANVTFTDTYPAGVVNAATPAVSSNCDNAAGGANDTTGGAAGGNTIGLAGNPGANDNDRAANTTCTVQVTVTAAAAGTYNNVTGVVDSTSSAGDADTAAATLTVVRPTLTKSFSPDPIASGGTSTLTLVLANASDVPFTINTPGFTDTFPVAPGPMTVAAPLTTTNTCGGTLVDSGGGALAAGDAGIRLNGGTIPAHGSCQITVAVTASALGTYTNAIAAGNLSTSGGTNAAAASGTLTVPNRPTVAKAFTASTIPVLGVSTLTVTLSNDNPFAAGGATFTDTLPAGLVTSGSPSTNCGGIASGTTSTLSLTGGTIPAGAPGSCVVTIGVLNDADTDATVARASGSYANTIAAGGLSTAFGSNAAAALANLNVIGGYKSVRLVTDADGSGGATPGDTLRWSVFYGNPAGGSAIAAFQVTDVVNPGMSVAATPAVSYTPAACSAGVANGAFDGSGSAGLFAAAFSFNAGCTVRVDYDVRLLMAAGNTTVSDQASGAGTGLGATPSDNIDATTTGLPAGVTPTAGSVAQTQLATLINPTMATVQGGPGLTAVKSSAVFSDPFNNQTDPKRIPGAFITYSLVVTNSGTGGVDSDATVIVDPVPTGTDLFVGDLGGAGSGPVAFSDGAPATGLTYTFTALGSATDDVGFSNDNGVTYTYTPVPNADGVDSNVTHVRINPKGVFAGDPVAGAPSPNFSVAFRVRLE